jgi:hypothetical protein
MIHDVKLGLHLPRSVFKYYKNKHEMEKRKASFTIELDESDPMSSKCSYLYYYKGFFETHGMSVAGFNNCDNAIIVRKLSKNGKQLFFFYCQSCRTVTKSLFKPTLSSRLLCRKCHNLTYLSSQMHDSRFDNKNIIGTTKHIYRNLNGDIYHKLKGFGASMRILTRDYIRMSSKIEYVVEKIS